MREAATERALSASIIALTFNRLVVNITRRFAYPFLPEIARQLGVPLSSVQSVMALQAGVGVASPVFGPLSERFGRKRVLMGIMAGMTAVGLIGALIPGFWPFALVMLALGVGKIMFDPVLLAYVGDHVPYAIRGRAVGITELSWALSLIIAAPAAGFLLATYGLGAVFLAIAILALAGLALLWWVVPPDHPAPNADIQIVSPVVAWRVLRNSPAALGALAYIGLVMLANEIVFINYGAWMEQVFALEPAVLGALTTIIALAEISGEFSVIGFVDRLGKRRMALVGVVLSSLMYGLLPLLDFSLLLALAALFVMFFFVEISIVSALPLFTEVLPGARGVMMSSVIGAAAVGRLLGATLGGLLFTSSFLLAGAAALLIGLCAAFCLRRYVLEG